MAKIKSTLDIVMERTRNLTITQEEKDALRRKELLDRVRGWVQALVDGKSSVSDLRSAYDEEAAQAPEARTSCVASCSVISTPTRISTGCSMHIPISWGSMVDTLSRRWHRTGAVWTRAGVSRGSASAGCWPRQASRALPSFPMCRQTPNGRLCPSGSRSGSGSLCGEVRDS